MSLATASYGETKAAATSVAEGAAMRRYERASVRSGTTRGSYRRLGEPRPHRNSVVTGVTPRRDGALRAAATRVASASRMSREELQLRLAKVEAGLEAHILPHERRDVPAVAKRLLVTHAVHDVQRDGGALVAALVPVSVTPPGADSTEGAASRPLFSAQPAIDTIGAALAPAHESTNGYSIPIVVPTAASRLDRRQASRDAICAVAAAARHGRRGAAGAAHVLPVSGEHRRHGGVSVDASDVEVREPLVARHWQEERQLRTAEEDAVNALVVTQTGADGEEPVA